MWESASFRGYMSDPSSFPRWKLLEYKCMVSKTSRFPLFFRGKLLVLETIHSIPSSFPRMKLIGIHCAWSLKLAASLGIREGIC